MYSWLNLGLQKYQILDCPSSKNLTEQFQEAQVAMKLLCGTKTKQLSQPKLMSIALASYCLGLCVGGRTWTCQFLMKK
jgi:hypothetical protein